VKPYFIALTVACSIMFCSTLYAQQNVVPTVGNVGLGTIPSEKLDVNGNVRIRELAGPGLRPVFVDEMGKLVRGGGDLGSGPGEVTENGINLGKMDAILLKKIEELTLHVIQLAEDNKKLSEEIKGLKK
jgi:hypothetical protein